MFKIDWSDIGQNAAAGFGAFTALNLITTPLIAGAVTIAAVLAREVWQAWKKDASMNPATWTMQKHLDWLAAAAVVVAMLWQT